MSNLLAQKKEIKRHEKEEERRKADDEESERLRDEEEKEGVVRGFEEVAMGLEKPRPDNAHDEAGKTVKPSQNSLSRGVKRTFTLDEEEMVKNAREERAKVRKELEEEKVCQVVASGKESH